MNHSNTLMTLNNVIAVDEVGIGCVAGPIFAAAVWVPVGFHHPDVRDSKKLGDKKLAMLADLIRENCRVRIGMASVSMINKIGTWASWDLLISELIFFMRARKGFGLPVYIDGIRRPQGHYRLHTEAKGDAKYFNIAAASIVAKDARRRYMQRLHEVDDRYGFDSHEGYGTPAHVGKLHEYGPSKYHRRAATSTLLKTKTGDD